MSREEAYTLLTKYLQNKNLIKHCLACEVAMKALYKRLNTDYPFDAKEEEKWGITGLLHDVDYELVQKEGKLDQHGSYIFDIEPDVIPEDIAHAIKSHNFQGTHVTPVSPLDWAITCVDQLTGLIIACALVRPEKQLSSVTADFVLKKMNEKSFAAGANREMILLCGEKLGIQTAEFVDITLTAMQSIHENLGL